MVTRILETVPAAALAAPSSEARTQSLALLRAEVDAQSDPRAAALLLHEVARLHENRDDLSSAARDALEATKRDGSFVEPLQALIGIAIRSRSKANLTKLFARLYKLASEPEQKLEAALGLVHTLIANENLAEAITTLDEALDEMPAASPLWLLLEELATRRQDRSELLRAVVGRAAHARSPALRSLLLERAARLQLESPTPEDAYASLAQAYDEVPTWRGLRTWETLSTIEGNYRQAKDASSNTAALLLAALAEQDEADLYQIPKHELRIERANAAQIRSIVYSLLMGDVQQARSLTAQLVEQDPQLRFIQLFRAGLARTTSDHLEFARAHADLMSEPPSRRKISDELRIFSAVSVHLAAHTSRAEELLALAESTLRDLQQPNWASTLLQWPTPASSSGAEFEGTQRFWKSLESRVLKDQSGWFVADHAAGPPTPTQLLEAELELKVAAAFQALFAACCDGSEVNSSQLLRERASRAFSECESIADALGREAAASPRWLRQGVRYLLARLGGDQHGELASVEEQLSSLFTHLNEEPPASVRLSRRSLAADLLRLRLSGQLDIDQDQQPHVDRIAEILDDAWIPLAHRLLGGTDRRLALARFATRTSVLDLPEWPRIVDAWFLTSPSADGDADLAVEPFESCSPVHDPFRLGCELARSIDGDETSTRSLNVLLNTAELTSDQQLRAGWIFQAALGHLRERQPESALIAFRRLFELDPSLQTALAPLAVCLSYSGDPAQLLQLARDEGGEEPTQSLISELERLCLCARYEPDHFPQELHQTALDSADRDLTTAPPALELACCLWQTETSTARQVFDAFEDRARGSSSEELLGPAKRALLLATTRDVTEDERLTQLLDFARLRPSHAADLAVWSVAHRISHARALNAAILRIAQRSASTEQRSASLALTALVDPDTLDDEHRKIHRGLLDQWVHRHETTSAELLRLTLLHFHHTPSPSTSDEARQFDDLARALTEHARKRKEEQPADPATQNDHADAQLARLAAAYRHAQAGQFESALAGFAELFDELPADPSVCVGLQLMAEQLGRADLEARATIELARLAKAGPEAAHLWERAGLLFADHLSDERQAEECFNAALVHAPGSPTSFERIYRITKRRKDRPRQIELLEARLVTAETDTLRCELLWEKARYCRLLGRRGVALRATAELIAIDPDHLPALSLSAELFLIDERWDEAAMALRRVALHPRVPVAQRRNAGLYAADLFEKVKRPRDGVELLERLSGFGIDDYSIQLRRARALARTEDWGAAYQVFLDLNDVVDTISERLESARMMLAIQRDHLRDAEQLKESVRRVLRDCPTDRDAIDLALNLDLSRDDRYHLLASAREDSRSKLEHSPLDVAEIRRFADLCVGSGDLELERAALGILALLGQLPPMHAQRFAELSHLPWTTPSRAFRADELEQIVPSSLFGPLLKFLQALSPRLTLELEADLEIRGVTPLMRLDEFSGDPMRAEIGIWAGALGVRDFTLFVGGHDVDGISGLNLELPTVIVGKNTPLPLGREDRARLASLLLGLQLEVAVLLTQPAEVSTLWIEAVSNVCTGARPQASDLWTSTDSALDMSSLTEHLDKALVGEERERLAVAYQGVQHAGQSASKAALEMSKAALRMACLVSGEPTIIRTLPEYLPSDEADRNEFVADLVRFCVGKTFFELRKGVGLAQ